MDSFGTLDLLKQIGIEVKNHMSSLEAEQVQALRTHILKASAPAEKPAKKTATRKTATKKAAASTEAEPKKASTATKTVARSRKAAPAKTEAAEPAPSSTRKVIKRRQRGDEEEVSTAPAPAPEVVETPAQEWAPEAELSAELSAAPESAPEAEPMMATEVVEEVVAEEAPPVTAPVKPAARAESPAAGIERSSKPLTPAPQIPVGRDLRSKPSTIIRKAGDALLEDEMIDSSFTQRRLRIIQSAPPPSAKPAETTETTRTKRFDDFSTDRSPGGMFKPVTSVLGDQEDADRKRRGAAGGSQERSIEEIRISDFRKREIIFQPRRKKLPPGKQTKKTEITTPSAQKRKIKIAGSISVGELAQRLSEKPKDIIRKLMDMGTDVESVNQQLDFDTATLLANEYKYELENVTFDESKYFGPETDPEESLKPRPPVITVMGHVDHGKTTLLDSIRNASVAAGEAGGITQHIGAYSVSVNGHPITFLDTPGHEAFKDMRARGANVTDIVVLVVAADDGIMPQTKESIALAQSASVPLIVAANKADKHDANIDRLKQMLSENNVLVEEWGGEVPMVAVSALKKTGIKELLETIQLQAEVLELKANPKRPATGSVIESRMVTGRGIVTDALVTNGTLSTGDYIVCGLGYGRVRAMLNDQGKTVKDVLPGFPVEFAGLDETPSPGEKFFVVKSEADARTVVENRRDEARKAREKASERKPISVEEFFADTGTDDKKMLNIMIKADVFGSVEAIADSVNQILSDKVGLKIVSKGVGVITDNDVQMAKTANAQIFAFNVKTESKAKDTAKREVVTIHSLSIIYELLDKVKESMEALLDPIRIERPIGKAEVKQAFSVSKIGVIAGSMVTDGKITRNCWARVFRGNDKVAEGTVISLKRFKDDAKETIKGQECGIGVEKYTDIRAGDRIEAFQVEFEKAKL